MRPASRLSALKVGAGPTSAAGGGRAYARQVLIVERDRMARRGLAHVVSSSVCLQVAGAVGLIREAELLPAALPVDVVLVDADVPDIGDGDGIGRLLLRFHQARVVVHGTHHPAGVVALLRHGADGCLGRDIGGDALVRTLTAVLEGEVALPRAAVRLLVDALRTGAGQTCVEDLLSVLSPRECEVLTALSRGCSNAEIARRLCLAPSTVKTHVSSILQKTGSRSRFALQSPGQRASA